MTFKMTNANEPDDSFAVGTIIIRENGEHVQIVEVNGTTLTVCPIPTQHQKAPAQLMTTRVRASDEVGKVINLPEGPAVITYVGETSITYIFITERQATLSRLTGQPPFEFIP